MTASSTRHPDSLFATRLKAAQQDAGIKNEELAWRLDVSLRLVQKYRAGTVQPRYGRLINLAHVLGKPVSFFLDEEAA